MTTLDNMILDLLEAEPNLERAQIENRLRHPGVGVVLDKLAALGKIKPCEDTWSAPIFWCVAQ